MPASEAALAGPVVDRVGRPGWAPPVTLVLAVAGLAVSAYLTYAHYTSPAVLSCPDTGLVNCTKVTTSPQSTILGFLPVALAGLLYFVGMTALCSPPAWRTPAPAVRWLRLLGAVAGVAMVCWLVYAEFVVIGALCLYCTAVHVIAFLLFIAVALASALTVPED